MTIDEQTPARFLRLALKSLANGDDVFFTISVTKNGTTYTMKHHLGSEYNLGGVRVAETSLTISAETPLGSGSA